jgi:hypothetical protein
MAVVFRRGQELGRKDGLSIFLKTKEGATKNAAEISYNLYDFTTGIEVLIPPSNRIPVNPAIGEYFASFIVPLDSNLGSFRIRWFFREYTSSPQVQILQDFEIVSNEVNIVNLPGASAIEQDLVRSIRVLLRDNNPGRNYMFRPPTGEGTINQFTRVFGFIWEDAELLEYLRTANDIISMYPPQTFYATLDDLISNHRNWRSLVLTGGMVYALQAVANNWISEEFSYAIGGVSLDIEKSSKYQSMMNDIDTRFKEFLENAKATVFVMRGLKQSRFGVGIRSSFGPSVGRGALTPRRFIGL